MSNGVCYCCDKPLVITIKKNSETSFNLCEEHFLPFICEEKVLRWFTEKEATDIVNHLYELEIMKLNGSDTSLYLSERQKLGNECIKDFYGKFRLKQKEEIKELRSRRNDLKKKITGLSKMASNIEDKIKYIQFNMKEREVLKKEMSEKIKGFIPNN